MMTGALMLLREAHCSRYGARGTLSRDEAARFMQPDAMKMAYQRKLQSGREDGVRMGGSWHSLTRVTRLGAVLALLALACDENEPVSDDHDASDSAPRDAMSAGRGGSQSDGGPLSSSDAGVCADELPSGLEFLRDQPLEMTATVVDVEQTPGELRLFLADPDDGPDAGSDATEFGIRATAAALPADLIRVGDSLTIAYEVEQEMFWSSRSLVVTRSGDLVLFAGSIGHGSGQAEPWPELERFGIAISAGPESCRHPPFFGCTRIARELRVAYAGEPATRSADGLLRSGDLTVAGSLLERVDLGNCDAARLELSVVGFMPRR